jgi:hypothetical protein
MEITEVKVGTQVVDRWYPDWGIGTIMKITKTRVKIAFPKHGTSSYDAEHLREFIESDLNYREFEKSIDMIKRKRYKPSESNQK